MDIIVAEPVLKLANDFEFTVNSLSVNYYPADKSRSLVFIKYFEDAKIKEIEEQLLPENMKTIIVLKNSNTIYELDGYTELVSADINIDQNNQIFTVRAAQPKEV